MNEEPAAGHAELSGEDGERLLDFGQRFVQVASSNSKTGVLPPSSPPKRFMFLAQAAMIARPVPELPVKLMTGTSGESIIVRAALASTSVQMFTTPVGKTRHLA